MLVCLSFLFGKLINAKEETCGRVEKTLHIENKLVNQWTHSHHNLHVFNYLLIKGKHSNNANLKDCNFAR